MYAVGPGGAMVEPVAYWNGSFVPQSAVVVRPHDAGLVFGATVTDFCRTYRHRLFRWADHLDRLRRDGARCGIPVPDAAELTAASERLVAENAPLCGPTDELAVVTFLTPGPLGYMIGGSENGPPTLVVHTFPLPRERYRRFFTEGVTLVVAGESAGVLPAVKHRSRLHWWQAGRGVPGDAVSAIRHADGAPDTAVGAVLAVRGGVVYRPPPGVTLDSISVKVAEELCGSIGIGFATRGDWSFAEMSADEELLMTGTAFGIAGVRRLFDAGRLVEYPWAGPVLTRLQAAWSELVGVDLATQFG